MKENLTSSTESDDTKKMPQTPHKSSEAQTQATSHSEPRPAPKRKQTFPRGFLKRTPPSASQLALLEQAGVLPHEVTCSCQASKLLDTIASRQRKGLATLRQIRCLERYGFANVERWSYEAATEIVNRIAHNMWKLPPELQ